MNVDNVGSKQMQQIRSSLRGHGVLIMGKNTTMRKAIRGHLDQNPQLEVLLPQIKGNVGFVFTSEELTDVRDLILANKVSRAGEGGRTYTCYHDVFWLTGASSSKGRSHRSHRCVRPSSEHRSWTREDFFLPSLVHCY